MFGRGIYQQLVFAFSSFSLARGLPATGKPVCSFCLFYVGGGAGAVAAAAAVVAVVVLGLLVLSGVTTVKVMRNVYHLRHCIFMYTVLTVYKYY